MRRAVGVEKITLFGVSYGTKVALAYAARYPQHVERLVLDSVVEPTGPGAFSQESLAAVPRVLRHALPAGLRGDHPGPGRRTSRRSCRACGRRLLYGPLVPPTAGASVPGSAALRLLGPPVRRATSTPRCGLSCPRAVRSAREGDPAPLLRLALRSGARQRARARPLPERRALRGDDCARRGRCRGRARRRWTHAPAAAEAALRALPTPTALGPFDRTTVLFASSPFQLCARWPTAPAEPRMPDGPFPAVPTLVLAGEDDLRTPLEAARRIAARIPGATLLSVPETGHSVLSGFPRRCGLRAADDFFAGRPVRPCVAAPARRFRRCRSLPRSLAQVTAEPQVGGQARAARSPRSA